jgi:hypothetical protein
MDRSLNFMEIKEIKKNNNFGEIEMCLNKQLTYNIKIKSKVCELFVLRKDDFLRLSVNFKDYIEKFLKVALFKFLKLYNDITYIIAQIEDGKEPHDILLELNDIDHILEDDIEHEEEEDDKGSYAMTTTIENKPELEKTQTKDSRLTKQSLEKIDGIIY